VGKSQGAHNGELGPVDTEMTETPGTYVYTNGDCTIHLHWRTGEGWDVKQDGACSSVGFGAFVDATGFYPNP
jgi:hypothetical protein